MARLDHRLQILTNGVQDAPIRQQTLRSTLEWSYRLLMLRAIREYGLEHLSLDGKLEQAQWTHARYYLALAEEAEPALKGPQPLPWLECLEREHDNLREALCRLIAHGENGISMGTELALRLGKALERFWIVRGYVKEGRDLLEQALKSNSGVSLSIQGNAMHMMRLGDRWMIAFGLDGTDARAESIKSAPFFAPPLPPECPFTRTLLSLY